MTTLYKACDITTSSSSISRDMVVQKEEEIDDIDYIKQQYDRLTNHYPMNMFHGKSFINYSRLHQYKEKATDIILMIHYYKDINDKKNSEEILEIKTHKIILMACTVYFDKLIEYNKDKLSHTYCHVFNNIKSGCGTTIHSISSIDTSLSISSQKISIYIDSIEIDHSSILIEFFKLFYIPIFDDTQLTLNELNFIKCNILVINALSIFFQYTTLEQYCKQKIYERLDLQSFTTVFNYCIQPNPMYIKNKYMYYVLHDKKDIFKRLISWLMCCADLYNNSSGGKLNIKTQQPQDEEEEYGGGSGNTELPYNNIDDDLRKYNDEYSFIDSFKQDHIITMNIEQQEEEEEEVKRSGVAPLHHLYKRDKEINNNKRKRCNFNNDKKLQLIEVISSLIENYDKYDKFSNYITDNYRSDKEINHYYSDVNHTLHHPRTTKIRSFVKICIQCMYNNNTTKEPYIQYINQVLPNNKVRTWLVFINYNIDASSASLLTRIYHDYKKTKTREEETEEEEEEEDKNLKLECHTKISTLSKLLKPYTHDYNDKHVIMEYDKSTVLKDFKLHHSDYCYNGKCDKCNTNDTKIFIIKYKITANEMLNK